MATLKNNTDGPVKVRGTLVKPGQSVEVDEPSGAEKLMFGLEKAPSASGRAAARLVDDKKTDDKDDAKKDGGDAPAGGKKPTGGNAPA